MNRSVIIYDNDCGFCDACRNLVEKNDRSNRFCFLGIRSKEAHVLAEKIGKTIDHPSPESFIVYNPDTGLWLDKSRAAQEVTLYLSGPLHIFYYILLIIPRFLADWGYKRIANNRHRLGPLVGSKTCRTCE